MLNSHVILSASLCAVLAAGVLGQAAPFVWTGTQSGERYGTTVAWIGDIDGDFYDELAIGAPLHFSANGLTGKVEIRSINNGVLFTLFGEGFGDQFGAAIDSVGDLDGDEIPDFVIGAWGNSQGAFQGGKAYVISGANGSTIHEWTGAAFQGQFGFSVASVGDTNNDGVNDVLIGAPGEQLNRGAAYLYDGATGALRFPYTGQAAGDRFGHAVAGAGRINTDQKDDFVICAPNASVGGVPDSGRVWVKNGFPGSTLAILDGPMTGGLFGFSIAGPGDLGGDAQDDLVVGAPADSTLTVANTGRACVLPSSIWTTPIIQWWGTAPGQSHGRTVSAIGDYDGDGTPDIGVGAPLASGPLGGAQGALTIYSGLSLAPVLTIAGESFGEEFGTSLAGGDVNYDGLADIAVGAPRHATPVGMNVGRVAVYLAPGWGQYGVGEGTLNTVELDGGGSVAPGSITAVWASNAPPGSFGVLTYAIAPGNLLVTHPAGTLALHLDIPSMLAQPLFPIVYNAIGVFGIGITTNPNGLFANVSVYTQVAAFGVSGTPRFSNGLAITFGG